MKQLPLTSPGFIYVEQSFREWLDILGYAETTRYNLPNHVREFFHYLEGKGKSQITEITTGQMQSYYEELKQRSNVRRGGGLSSSYLNKHLQALRKLSDYLRQSGRLALPLADLKRESSSIEEVPYLSQAEIERLYQVSYQDPSHVALGAEKQEAVQYRDRAMLTIFYGCGLRRKEGVHLNVSDIDLDKGVLHVRKGKNYKERFVPFSKKASKMLQEWIYDHRPVLLKAGREEALFIGRYGNRMQGQGLAARLKVLQDRTEDMDLKQKQVSLHVLRHSIATHLLANGMALEKISRFLGHSSLESTQIYTHLSADRQDLNEHL